MRGISTLAPIHIRLILSRVCLSMSSLHGFIGPHSTFHFIHTCTTAPLRAPPIPYRAIPSAQLNLHVTHRGTRCGTSTHERHFKNICIIRIFHSWKYLYFIESSNIELWLKKYFRKTRKTDIDLPQRLKNIFDCLIKFKKNS